MCVVSLLAEERCRNIEDLYDELKTMKRRHATSIKVQHTYQLTATSIKVQCTCQLKEEHSPPGQKPPFR